MALLVGSWLLTRAAQESVDKRGASCTRPLSDVLHDLLPDLSHMHHLIDALPVVLGLLVLVFCGRVDLRRLVNQMTLVYLIRVITTSATVLPSPICSASRPSCRAVGGCHACIFSGHTATTLLFAWHLQKCFPEYTYHLLAYSVLSSLLIVATRSHYTIDVLVAWIVVHSLVMYA